MEELESRLPQTYSILSWISKYRTKPNIINIIIVFKLEIKYIHSVSTLLVIYRRYILVTPT